MDIGGVMMARENVKQPKSVKNTKKSIANYDPDELIFALDIGTRTVIGVVGIAEDDKLKILAAEVVQHKSRAMLDGQIHDITLVAEIVEEVKFKLENKLGVKLEKVAIAAAGRVLKTYSVKVQRALDANSEVTKDIVSSMEIEGIQKAQTQLESEQNQEEKTVFYCVGYSIISYSLNNYVISSLLGHKGKTAEVEILATFLPHIVIDSLYTVMNRVNLEVVNLTLEPIAAINVCIPPNLRLLNLALVDIGAGTSDIAITKDGAVIGYAMAPFAGDEITEKIAHYYLVDFNMAESIKLSLSDDNSETVVFTDVIGMKREINKSEIYKTINDSIVHLGETIAEKILNYNQKAPNAVFCVGGGSQIKGITEVISKKLNLPLERVVVRGREIVKSVKYSGKKLVGPEAITPLGIAVNALQQKEHDFLSVTLNGKKIRLFNSKKLNVADAFILTGFDPKQLIGRTGKSVTFTINSEKRTIRGEYGKPAIITVNGESGSMETTLKPGDNIDVISAVDGKPAKPTIAEVIDLSTKKVVYNRLTIDLVSKIILNDEIATSDTIIKESDKLEFYGINTIVDFANSIEINIKKFKAMVNGNVVDDYYMLKNGDKIELIENNYDNYNTHEKSTISNDNYSFNYETDIGKPLENNFKKHEIVVDSMDSNEGKIYTKIGRTVKVSVNGKNVVLDGDKSNYLFLDVFKSMEFDVARVKGPIYLKINGKNAGYTDKISNGDVIEINWNNN